MQQWYVCVSVSEIDVLVNNAGRTQRAFVIDSPLQIDRELIEVNVVGPVSLTKCVLPHMLARRHGYILVTGSITGKLRKPPSLVTATRWNMQWTLGIYQLTTALWCFSCFIYYFIKYKSALNCSRVRLLDTFFVVVNFVRLFSALPFSATYCLTKYAVIVSFTRPFINVSTAVCWLFHILH